MTDAVINAAKTHCQRGHPFDAVNTYRRPNGQRACRACQRQRGAVKTGWPQRLVPSLRERLFGRLVPCADPACGCDCRLWEGVRNKKGYGKISIANRWYLVHRVAWELENGPIPDGLQIDHVKARGCRHKNCASLAHLQPVTCRENLLRGDTITAASAAVTHCPQGHPYDEANTRRRSDNSRRCRACHREQTRRRRAPRNQAADEAA